MQRGKCCIWTCISLHIYPPQKISEWPKDMAWPMSSRWGPVKVDCNNQRFEAGDSLPDPGINSVNMDYSKDL